MRWLVPGRCTNWYGMPENFQIPAIGLSVRHHGKHSAVGQLGLADDVDLPGRGLPGVALAWHGVGDTQTGIATVKVPAEPRTEDMPAQIGEALHTLLTGEDREERSAEGVRWAAGNTWAATAAAETRSHTELAKR
jgi:hypothetical protein